MILVGLAALDPPYLPAEEPAPAGQAAAATVGAEPVTIGEVERFLARVLHGRAPGPELLPYARAQGLEEIIARRLVLIYAGRKGEAATDEERAAATARLKSRLAAQHRSIADQLKAEGISQADLRRQLAWDIVWDKYLGRYLSAERRAAYFQAHRRELDGSQLVVSHVLLRPAAGAGPAAVAGLLKQAEGLRRRIVAGELTFADAARQYSTGPSRSSGGRLGPIGRHGPMDESFSRAAFALAVGQVSPPVQTPFGVHLIRCDEVRPGSQQLADAGQQVDDALARELLEKLAALERRATPVSYTGAWPHFQPGTRTLAPSD
jgi:parvulin-like peptidyl-prolyl isomerase